MSKYQTAILMMVAAAHNCDLVEAETILDLSQEPTPILLDDSEGIAGIDYEDDDPDYDYDDIDVSYEQDALDWEESRGTVQMERYEMWKREY